MEKRCIEGDVGMIRSAAGGLRAFSASMNGISINVYGHIRHFGSIWPSDGLLAVQRLCLPASVGCSPRSLHGQFLQSTFYPLQTMRNRFSKLTEVLRGFAFHVRFYI
ncbi:MAG: hypothetical protein KGJ09_10855 [Candidatus Omnitrophica bacterium]|nr:hypothetical protein [Candidatus Omnitrophota bacterium]